MAEDSDDVFPFSALPVELHHLLIEKFSYSTFAVFNECSRLTADIINGLPNTMTFPLNVERILFWKGKCRVYNKKSVEIDPIPPNFRIFSNYLVALEKNMDILPHLNIKTQEIHVNIYADNSACDSEFVSQMLKKFQPEFLACRARSEDICFLEEVKKLKRLSLISSSKIGRKALLSLPVPNLEIKGIPFSARDIKEFVQQWREGKRIIEHVMLSVAFSGEELWLEFGKEGNYEADRRILYFNRKMDEEEWLSIRFLVESERLINIALSNDPRTPEKV